MLKKQVVRWAVGIALVFSASLALGACMSSKDSMSKSSDQSMSKPMTSSTGNSMTKSGDSTMSQ
ncbi:MAG TPA: hypothetical protein VMW87_16440 [Spirochaetia bacterium]|nr:hypothetical protein [Spirochaetia bacterium]